MMKRKLGLAALAVLAMGILMMPGTARAECIVTSSVDLDDTVVCASPPETGSVVTDSGEDTVTVMADGEINSSGTAINTGYGNDTVSNYGIIRAEYAGVDLKGGNDVLYNDGIIEAGDDGVLCSPAEGRFCQITNDISGSISASSEAIDVLSKGGTLIVTNNGTIHSDTQEIIHMRGDVNYPVGSATVTNHGVMDSRRIAVEAYRVRLTLDNSGTISTTGQAPIDLDTYDDTITNTGTISTRSYEPAIILSGGRDVLTNRGTISAQNDEVGDAAVDMGYSNDTLRSSGTIRETRSGYAAVEMGRGSDTMIIEGGEIAGLIDGDSDFGAGEWDKDTLVFELIGTQAEIDQLVADMSAQSGAEGSVTYRGQTYRWRGFEIITLSLTVESPTPTLEPTGTTEPPTPTPDASSTSEPTSTPGTLPTGTPVSATETPLTPTLTPTETPVPLTSTAAPPTSTPAPTETASPPPVGPTPTPDFSGQICLTSSTAPCLISPPDGASVQGSPVTFTWQEEPNSASYRVAISTTADFSTGVMTMDVPTTHYDRDLAPGTYYWKVWRITSSGSLGTWSSIWVITVTP